MIFLLNFLSVFHNLRSVKVLVISCYQILAWVLLSILSKEYNHLKRDWINQVLQWQNEGLFIQETLKRTLKVMFSLLTEKNCCGELTAY